jgi:AraC family transcriptional regulator of adaptative response/methylated-DNA-[protein]-cysteine methyltransferase
MATNTQLSIYTDKDKAEGGFSKAFLNKVDVKERLRNTKLLLKDASIYLERWETGDEEETIYWQASSTAVGEVLVAATKKGVCFLGFSSDDHRETLADLRGRFPVNPIEEKRTKELDEAFDRINDPRQELPVRLHLKGTDFQLGIWVKLLLIPFGGLVTYSEMGNGARNARATGTAVGANPVSVIVPCHRVVRADGSYDGYYWGPEYKKKLLAYEAALATEGNKNPIAHEALLATKEN